MAQSRQISTSSFYGSRWNRIRIGTSGVQREAWNVQIVLPELSNSDAEDNEDENEVESFKIAASERVELDSDIEEIPMNADDPEFIEDGMDSMDDSEANATLVQESKKPTDGSTKSKMNAGKGLRYQANCDFEGHAETHSGSSDHAFLRGLYKIYLTEKSQFHSLSSHN